MRTDDNVFFYIYTILQRTKVTYITITMYKLQITIAINIAYNTYNDNNDATNRYNTTTAANILF